MMAENASPSSSRNIAFVTLGCSKNVVDSEKLAGVLARYGFHVSHTYVPGETDIVIINTCGFILDAKEESINTILEFVEIKRQTNLKKVMVMGCLTQRYRGQIKKEIPGLDGIFGANEPEAVVKAIVHDQFQQLPDERILSTPGHFAYLKISEGCDHRCSFCAIPLIRGRHRSVPLNKLVREAERLAAAGVKELVLIAQDLTYYGMDLYRKRRLADLLNALARVDGIEWIRLHYLYPAAFPMDVLNVMRDEPKVLPYIDIPLQHVSSRILKSMRRGMDSRQTRDFVQTIREQVPGAAVRTTFIVGYPGETSEEFLELYRFTEEMKFDRVGVFTYSHEENTQAYKLKDDVPWEEKSRRQEKLMELQQQISLEHNQHLIGTYQRVIVDEQTDDFFYARSMYDSPEVDNDVLIKPAAGIQKGTFVNVKITGADFFELYAEKI